MRQISTVHDLFDQMRRNEDHTLTGAEHNISWHYDGLTDLDRNFNPHHAHLLHSRGMREFEVNLRRQPALVPIRPERKKLRSNTSRVPAVTLNHERASLYTAVRVRSRCAQIMPCDSGTRSIQMPVRAVRAETLVGMHGYFRVECSA